MAEALPVSTAAKQYTLMPAWVRSAAPPDTLEATTRWPPFSYGPSDPGVIDEHVKGYQIMGGLPWLTPGMAQSLFLLRGSPRPPFSGSQWDKAIPGDRTRQEFIDAIRRAWEASKQPPQPPTLGAMKPWGTDPKTLPPVGWKPVDKVLDWLLENIPNVPMSPELRAGLMAARFNIERAREMMYRDERNQELAQKGWPEVEKTAKQKEKK